MRDEMLTHDAFCRTVQLLGDHIRKIIGSFRDYASNLYTTFTTICEAYEVANAAAASSQLGHPYLITSKTAPTLSRHGRYTVITEPCGYDAQVNTEQVRNCDCLAPC